MGWFDEQIKQRKKNDEDLFSEAFVGIADAVLGSKMSAAFSTDEAKAQGAIEEILKYYHVKPREVPDSIKGLNDRLEYLLRPNGIMRRNVNLEKGWYKDAIGAVLGTRKDDGSVVAFIPKGLSGYVYFDAPTGKWVKLTKKNESLFEDEGICFYKPFPLGKLTLRSLMRYIIETLSTADFVLIALATLATTAIGLLGPKLNNLLMGTVVNSKNYQLLIGITVFMISVSISTMLITSVKSLLMARINTKMSLSVQAATMMRVLSLPADFFKKYASGDLSSRAQYIQSLCNMLISTVLTTGLTSLFSLMYISQIFAYAPALVVPALGIILATIIFSLITTFAQMKYTKKKMELSAQESGMSYAMITGVQKIKLSGAEKRMFARWSKLYSEQLMLSYNPPMFLRAGGAFSAIISMGGMILMYFMAVQSGVSVADYYAFNTAYGMVSGAFMSIAGIATTIAQFKPTIEMAKPIMDAIPEVSEGKLEAHEYLNALKAGELHESAAFAEQYEAAKQAGEAVVVITLSSNLSGTYQSAVIAAEDYDNVYIVDSGTTAIGGGILTELSLNANGTVNYAIVGIGINCLQQEADFHPDIRNMATSLSQACGRTEEILRGTFGRIPGRGLHAGSGSVRPRASVPGYRHP